jgi:hypothetical protein
MDFFANRTLQFLAIPLLASPIAYEPVTPESPSQGAPGGMISVLFDLSSLSLSQCS